jgi:hypothetical protein
MSRKFAKHLGLIPLSLVMLTTLGGAGSPAIAFAQLPPPIPCPDGSVVSFPNVCPLIGPAPRPAPRIPPPKPAPAPKPPQGPAVSWRPTLGGLIAQIQDRSGVGAQCTYTSDWYTRSFYLNANSTYDLVIIPAIPKLANWNVTVSCDNGATTKTQTFF